jgi:hypothetical protein
LVLKKTPVTLCSCSVRATYGLHSSPRKRRNGSGTSSVLPGATKTVKWGIAEKDERKWIREEHAPASPSKGTHKKAYEFSANARGNSAVIIIITDSINTPAISDNSVELQVFLCSRKEHIPTETR